MFPVQFLKELKTFIFKSLKLKSKQQQQLSSAFLRFRLSERDFQQHFQQVLRQLARQEAQETPDLRQQEKSWQQLVGQR